MVYLCVFYGYSSFRSDALSRSNRRINVNFPQCYKALKSFLIGGSTPLYLRGYKPSSSSDLARIFGKQVGSNRSLRKSLPIVCEILGKLSRACLVDVNGCVLNNLNTEIHEHGA